MHLDSIPNLSSLVSKKQLSSEPWPALGRAVARPPSHTLGFFGRHSALDLPPAARLRFCGIVTVRFGQYHPISMTISTRLMLANEAFGFLKYDSRCSFSAASRIFWGSILAAASLFRIACDGVWEVPQFVAQPPRMQYSNCGGPLSSSLFPTWNLFGLGSHR